VQTSSPDSPYVIDVVDRRLVLTVRGAVICDVRYRARRVLRQTLPNGEHSTDCIASRRTALLLSFDVSGVLGGVPFDGEDVLEYTPGPRRSMQCRRITSWSRDRTAPKGPRPRAAR
jgi:hypothetical protein